MPRKRKEEKAEKREQNRKVREERKLTKAQAKVKTVAMSNSVGEDALQAAAKEWMLESQTK